MLGCWTASAYASFRLCCGGAACVRCRRKIRGGGSEAYRTGLPVSLIDAQIHGVSFQTDRLNTALAGRYRIERHLGAGGMGIVYLAEDLKHHRKAALKVLKPELAAVLGAERFVVEIKTTASLQHPHILPILDSGTAEGDTSSSRTGSRNSTA